jgi:tetratricopeptide (TPR) repeat protein
LHQAAQAQSDLDQYDAQIAELRSGPRAYLADSTGARIKRGELLAWAEFAQTKRLAALSTLRESAELQDRVGQGEVDIPAREMLADMLLELGQPAAALTEYRRALEQSPQRFNGLYNAGRAAEAAQDPYIAKLYYAALLDITNQGADSDRPEIAAAQRYLRSWTGASSRDRAPPAITADHRP